MVQVIEVTIILKKVNNSSFRVLELQVSRKFIIPNLLKRETEISWAFDFFKENKEINKKLTLTNIIHKSKLTVN